MKAKNHKKKKEAGQIIADILTGIAALLMASLVIASCFILADYTGPQ